MKLSVNHRFINKTAMTPFPNPHAVGFENSDLPPDEVAHLIKHYGRAICVCLKALTAEDIEAIEAHRKTMAVSKKSGYKPLGLQAGNTYRSERFFLEAGYAGIDLDGGMRVEEALDDDFIKQYASLLYTTANHQVHQHRFRVLFELPEPVSDAAQYRTIVSALIQRFGSDESCKDAARLFYGSKGATVMKVFGKKLTPEVLAVLSAGDAVNSPAFNTTAFNTTAFNATAVNAIAETHFGKLNTHRVRGGGKESERQGASGFASVESRAGLLKFADAGKSKGERNSAAFWLACRLLETEGNTPSARQVLALFGRQCRPAMDEREVETVWQSAQRQKNVTSMSNDKPEMTTASGEPQQAGQVDDVETRDVRVSPSDLPDLPDLPQGRARKKEAALNEFDVPEAAIPERLGGIIDYLTTQTDAPKAFLFTSLLVSLAALAGNRVKLRLGASVIKPNLFAVILAGSSLCRKSTALGIAQGFLERVEREQAKVSPFDVGSSGSQEGYPSCKLLYPSSGSTEGLIETMRERRNGEAGVAQHSGLSVYSEFASLLEECRKDYNHGMKEFFMCVYDGRKYVRRLKHEESVIENPCLSLIGASTMEQFERRITEADKYSGFLQRFLFCHVGTTGSAKPRSLVELSEPDEEREKEIVQRLMKISAAASVIERKGIRFVLAPEAVAAYQESFEADSREVIELEREALDKSGAMGSYYARLDVMKFKIALLYTVAALAEQPISDLERAAQVEIGESVMLQALEATRYYQKTVKHLLFKEFAFGQAQQRQKRVLDLLQRYGGTIPNRRLLQATGWSAKEYAEVLRTLEEREQLVVQLEKTVSGQSTKVIKLRD